MKKKKYLISMIMASVIGGFLQFWPFEDDRSLWWIRCHLDYIQEQLTGLKSNLLEYHEINGRYPTNDEGLAVLDNFDAKFELTLFRHPESRPERTWNFGGGAINQFWWQDITKRIQDYRQKHGQVPQTTAEFLESHIGSALDPEWRSFALEDLESLEFDVAIGKEDNLYFLSPAGIMSPWLMPYVYENRNGLNQVLFADSPARRDSKKLYSIQVDDGIYVYSVGGRFYNKKLSVMWWQRYGPRILGVGLILTAVVFLVLIIRSSKKTAIIGILALAGSVGGGIGFGFKNITYATCYIMSLLFSWRDPEMIVQQKELLDKYHENGVINDMTYEKSLSALEYQSQQEAGRQ